MPACYRSSERRAALTPSPACGRGWGEGDYTYKALKTNPHPALRAPFSRKGSLAPNRRIRRTRRKFPSYERGNQLPRPPRTPCAPRTRGAEQGRRSTNLCPRARHASKSGTSALTRVMSLLGVDLPKHLVEAAAGNETGHWEPQRLVELNDQMLAEAGTLSADWRAFEMASLPGARREYIAKPSRAPLPKNLARRGSS